MTRSPRNLSSLLAAGALLLPVAAVHAADPAPFDLTGPELSVSVTRGKQTLPIGQVPSLAAGDKLEIRAELPHDQSVHYRLVSAFLRGATNPPPKSWIATAETWKRKDKDRILKLTVPADARQIVLFLVPDTGGDVATISDAVRGKPGEFVSVTQDINQVSLDHARLNAFVAGIQSQENNHPEYLKTIAPTLASSLSIKLNDDCLAKVVQSQAACLLQNSQTLVLGDVHSNSLTETIAGTPTDLALQISATPQAGYGFYSAYINVIRDLTRIVGAFNNPEFTYLPALGIQKGAGITLQLNTAPSFRKPKSVLVAALPAIENDVPAPLRKSDDGAVCALNPQAVFKVDGAPLIYATGYAHDMTVSLTTRDGRAVEVPVSARADKGGYLLASPLKAADFPASSPARLHGLWGFEPFAGPQFLLQVSQAGGWEVDTGAQPLIVGRDNVLPIKGLAPSCVESVTMQTPGEQPQPVKWKVSDAQRIAVEAPLTGAHEGELQFAIKAYGIDGTTTVTARAYAEQSRIDGLALHAGDDTGVLTGLRLDQIRTLSIGGADFRPGTLSREGNADKLEVIAQQPDKAHALAAGASLNAQIVLNDGRKVRLPVTVATPRPQATVIAKTVGPAASPSPAASGPSIRLTDDALLPDSGRMTISLRMADGGRFTPQDVIAIATQDGSAERRLSASDGLRLESPQVAIASFDAASLGPSAVGPLRYRVVRSDATGDWQPLATLVRMPTIGAVSCEGSAAPCRMTGRNLFLVDAISADPAFATSVAVPSGFTGSALDVPAPRDGKLYLKLRDAPSAIQEVILPGA